MSSLIQLSSDPPNAEVELSRLDGSPIPQSAMYMRNNFRIPTEPPRGFTVAVPGSGPRSLSTEDLRTYETVHDRIVLECAGNGRGLMSPVPDGTRWSLGGASIIDVSGVRLADVLGHVPEAIKEIVATGIDSGTVDEGGYIHYRFSMPRELATSDEPLLVTHIGGEPLTIEHGAPVRLIVRRHYAMMSVKWLAHIEGITQDFDGHFVEKYRYYGDDSQPERSRVSRIQPRSIITSPIDGETVDTGAIQVLGSAWTGTGKVAAVDVSLNGGPWLPSDLERVGPGIARWRTQITVEAGQVVVAARATDSSGATQPANSRWNQNGYANNVQQHIELSVI